MTPTVPTDDDETIANDFLAGDLLIEDMDDLLNGEASGVVGGEENENEENENEENEEVNENEENSKVSEDKTKPGDEIESDNEFYLRGEYYKEIGVLPQDTVLKPDMTQLDLEDLYLKQIETNAVNRKITEVKEKLQAKGLNPDEILGDDHHSARQYQQTLEALGKLDYESFVEKTPDVTAGLRDMATEYFLSKNPKLEEEEVTSLVDRDIDKNDEETLFSKYTKHFATDAVRLGKQIDTAEQDRKQKEISKAESDAAYIRQKLASGTIGNRKYTKEEVKKIVEGMTVKNQVYDDGKGNRSGRITLFEKRRLEAKNNLDKSLELAVNSILGIDEEVIKDKSERVGSMKILDKLARASGSYNSKNNKPGKKQEELESLFLALDN